MSNENKLCQSQASPDVISNLPPDITQRILELLPLEEAAKTSILSRSWRYKWLSLPHLILDYNQFYDSVASRHNWFINEESRVQTYSYMISNILLHHIGSIDKFVLYLPDWLPNDSTISQWLEFVSRQGVKELTLEYHTNKNVSWSLFSCAGFSLLTHLMLDRCHCLAFPSTFKGFPCLISFTARYRNWNDNSNIDKLEFLISCCPQLEHLAIQGLYLKDTTLTIGAPKLHKFEIDFANISNFCLEGGSNVRTLSLDISKRCGRDMVALFNSMPVIERLVVRCFDCISVWFKQVRPVISFGQLRTLEVYGMGMPLHFGFTIPFLVTLLQGSPLLENLKIHHLKCERDLPLEDCILGHLKIVRLNLAGRLQGALQLIKFILSSSPVLEILVVELTWVFYPQGSEQYMNFAKELLEFPRASTKAEIIFKS